MGNQCCVHSLIAFRRVSSVHKLYAPLTRTPQHIETPLRQPVVENNVVFGDYRGQHPRVVCTRVLKGTGFFSVMSTANHNRRVQSFRFFAYEALHAAVDRIAREDQPSIRMAGFEKAAISLRSEEHMSELQSLMRISSSVFRSTRYNSSAFRADSLGGVVTAEASSTSSARSANTAPTLTH